MCSLISPSITSPFPFFHQLVNFVAGLSKLLFILFLLTLIFYPSIFKHLEEFSDQVYEYQCIPSYCRNLLLLQVDLKVVFYVEAATAKYLFRFIFSHQYIFSYMLLGKCYEVLTCNCLLITQTVFEPKFLLKCI